MTPTPRPPEGGLIEASALAKAYRAPPRLADLARGRLVGARVVALAAVDLAVARGEVVGVMGENGAGKSTLLRLLAGLTRASGGRITLDGRAAGDDGGPLRRRVGYMVGDERSFSLRLSPRENLAFFAALHGLPRRRALPLVDGLLVRVGLATDARRPFHQLSTGMRQRVAFARGLLGEPDVLLFDEPTRGVDREGARALRSLVGEARRSDRAILLATHDVEEAAALCDRVIVLARGRVHAIAHRGEPLVPLLDRAAAMERPRG